MASELKVNKLTGVTTAGSISVTGEGNSTTTNLQQGLCKAWVSADDGATKNDSFNVGTSTDHGTGDYSHALTNPFSNANYCQTNTSKSNVGAGRMQGQSEDRATASLIATFMENASGTLVGEAHSIMVTGDLA